MGLTRVNGVEGSNLWISNRATVIKCANSKSESPLENEGSQRQERGFFYDPERKDTMLGRNKTRLELWEEHLKDPIVALDKALKCMENS